MLFYTHSLTHTRTFMHAQIKHVRACWSQGTYFSIVSFLVRFLKYVNSFHTASLFSCLSCQGSARCSFPPGLQTYTMAEQWKLPYTCLYIILAALVNSPGITLPLMLILFLLFSRHQWYLNEQPWLWHFSGKLCTRMFVRAQGTARVAGRWTIPCVPWKCK